MYKIGLSSAGRMPDAEWFVQCRAAGIEAVEISLAGKDYPDFDYRKAAREARESGVDLWSFHLPFVFELYDVSRPDMAEDSVGKLSEMIKRASDVGIERMVIHASGEPVPEDAIGRRERMECAKESLARLADVASACGSVVAVEDLPRTCLGRNSDEILELIGAHDALRVCFDTNHLLGESGVDFIRKLKGKIITTHVSDYDFINERHWLPGEGDLDWSALLGALREIDYGGVWLYELGFACPKSILRPRDLTCEDIVRNAGELFEGIKPTVISERIPNIGMWV